MLQVEPDVSCEEPVVLPKHSPLWAFKEEFPAVAGVPETVVLVTGMLSKAPAVDLVLLVLLEEKELLPVEILLWGRPKAIFLQRKSPHLSCSPCSAWTVSLGKRCKQKSFVIGFHLVCV